MSNCDACKNVKKTEPVPYIVHESAQARNERTVKRLVIALIVAIALIFASNAIWLYAWMQYDYTSEESVVDVDANDGVANYIGNDGDIVNGADYGN
jgi:hypothetical protein